MHTLGARLRTRATFTSSGPRGRVRPRAFSLMTERAFPFPSRPRGRCRSRPPRPPRSSHAAATILSTNTVVTRSASRESTRVAAVTDADFPRVLNGPAPGFAEDALESLLYGSLPSENAALEGDGYNLGERSAVELRSAETGSSRRASNSQDRLSNAASLTSRQPSSLDGCRQRADREAVETPQDNEYREGRDIAKRVRSMPAGMGLVEGSLPGSSRQEQPRSPAGVKGHLAWPRPSARLSSVAEMAHENEQNMDILDNNQIYAREDNAADTGSLSYEELWEMQLKREEQSHQDACDKYAKILDTMMASGKASHMKPVERLITMWYPAVKERIEAEQAAVWTQKPETNKELLNRAGAFGGRNTYGPLLVMLKADKQAVLVMHEVVNLILMDGNKGVSTVKACLHVAELVQAEVNLMKMKEKSNKRKNDNDLDRDVDKNRDGLKWASPSPVPRKGVKELATKARDAMDSLEYTAWPLGAQVKLGAALIRFLLETACWTHGGGDGAVVPWDKDAQGGGGKPRAAFVHTVVNDRKLHRQGHLTLAPEVYNKLVKEDVTRLAAPRHLPMLVPPRDWTRPHEGGFLQLQAPMMRTKGLRAQKQALRKADLTRIYEGLNCLGKVRWRINTDILDTVVTCLDQKIAVGDLPTADDLPLPPRPEGVVKGKKKGSFVLPIREDFEDERDYKQALKIVFDYRRTIQKIKQKNANMHSLRCDMKIKVNIAQEFRDHIIYFPYNMDFRGRTYPIPPNLNILGSDFSRGVLMFDEARPLGERGLHWLKVHLANLYGEDKVPFMERVAFVERNMDKVRDSALRPLDGEGWWKGADSPWQCLAVCKDIVAALDSPDPTQYRSRLPVHQDGSCNGLQHYAALGLDARGGAQVNLVPSHKPGDVYSGVCDVVKQKVANEASTMPDTAEATDEDIERHRLAKRVQGLIDRKVVKQTVMTSVYGVTFVGARRQIQNVLEERLLSGPGVPTPEAELEAYKAATYVARLTMTVLEELFTEARNTMEWMMTISGLVAKEGQPMAWITPLGLPVVQPYRKRENYQVQTLLQGVHLREERDDVPVSVVRQKSAFPPNFVHSLDSTHMLLTAMAMTKAGMPFAAVHDSYWVHAGNVDHMNSQLRQSFVDLYSGPILEDLHESLQMRYPTIEFPPIPERGSLNLEDVKNSEYFFN